MTQQDALNVLDQATAAFQGTRQDHANIQIALSVINELVLKENADDEVKNTSSSNKSDK